MINESKTLFQKLVKNKKILATLIVVVVLAVAIPVAILASSKANNRKEAASSSPAGSSLDKTAAVAGDKSSTDNEKNAAPTPADTNATKPAEPAKETTNPPAEPSSVPKTSAYVYGNTSGNLTNGAGVASDGKFVYYNNPDDGYKLYKSLPDGSSKSKVMDSSAGSINIIDGWIYYYGGMTDSGIYKISTNGSNKKKLASARTLGIAVVNDWIYFMDQASPENYVIYKIKTDGSEKTKISLGNNPSLLCIEASSLVVIEDWIYLPLLNKAESRTQLFRVKTDGSGSQKVLNNNPRFFSISDNFIYYASNNYNEIRKSKVDGTGEKKFIHCLFLITIYTA